MDSDRLVSIAAGTLVDVGPAEAVSIAADAGWRGVGVWFDPTRWNAATTKRVRNRLDETGLIALDIEPVILGSESDHGEALIEAASVIGARHVLIASRSDDAPMVIERFGALCDLGAASNLTMVLEFLPIFGIRTLAEALQVVTSAGRPNGAVLVDNLHLARSGGTPDDLKAVDYRLLPYLQIADAPSALQHPSMSALVDEALHGRALIGDGQLPIRELLDAVPHVPLSLELRSRQLRIDYPDPTDRARAALTSWHRFCRSSSAQPTPPEYGRRPRPR